MKMIDKYENVSQQDLHSFNKKNLYSNYPNLYFKNLTLP